MKITVREFWENLMVYLDKSPYYDWTIEKCKCWETIKGERKLSDFEKGVMFARTGKIIESVPYTKQICNGTRERDECSCDGDAKRCNFYPKKKGIKK